MKKLCVLMGALFALSVHGVGIAADAEMWQPGRDVQQEALMPAERVQSADEIAVGQGTGILHQAEQLRDQQEAQVEERHWTA